MTMRHQRPLGAKTSVCLLHYLGGHLPGTSPTPGLRPISQFLLAAMCRPVRCCEAESK